MENKECKSCKNLIRTDAVKCYHCNSAQTVFGKLIDYAPVAIVCISIAQAIFLAFQVSLAWKERIKAEDVLKEIEIVKKDAVASLGEVDEVKMEASKMFIDVQQRTTQMEEKLKVVNDNLDSLKLKSSELESTIQDLDKGIKNSKSKIDGVEKSFNERTETLTKELEEQKREVSEHLTKLQWRDNLRLLADKAVSKGSRASYEAIFDMYNSMDQDLTNKEIILSYILQIKGLYLTGSKHSHINLLIDGKDTEDKDVPTEYAVNTLRISSDPVARHVAARILGNRKDFEALEALVSAIKEDENLDVVSGSVRSYKRITGYRGPSDVFGMPYIIIDWNDNIDSYREKYEDQGITNLKNKVTQPFGE